MPVFTLQNNPPKGWRRSDPLQEFWGHQEYVWSPPCQQQPCVRHQQSRKCCAWALWALTSHLFLLVLHSNPLGWKATECCSLHYTVLQPALKTCWDKGLPKRQKSHYKKTNKQKKALWRWCPQSKKATLQTLVTRHRFQPLMLCLFCSPGYLAIAWQK